MNTLILDALPESFWEIVERNKWRKYFICPEDKFDPKLIDIVVIRTKTKFRHEEFERYPNLKQIIRAGSGYDNIDLIEADKRNVYVCNTPEANATAAAELTLSFILALLKEHQLAKQSILASEWKEKLLPNWELCELKAVVVGVGRVGSRVAQMLRSMGAEVRGVDPYLQRDRWRSIGLNSMNYKEGLSWCNLLTFHCPLTAETKDYFNEDTLSYLDKPIWLVNTARGGVVTESAIAKGLEDDKLLGAALDVYDEEPCRVKEYMNDKRVYMTPHTGAYTVAAKERLCKEVIRVWQAFNFEGKVVFRVRRY